jgi:hypothetical protein
MLILQERPPRTHVQIIKLAEAHEIGPCVWSRPDQER